MSAKEEGPNNDTPGRTPRPGSGPEKGLEKVLAHAKEETRQQLSQAIEKQRKTGRRLMDILRQDVDKEMFRNIWTFLNQSAHTEAGERSDKQVKDVLLEGGWLAPEELEEARKSGEAYDPELGRQLVESAYISEQQLQDALEQQERSGQSFWRILVNRGLVAPKQIADVRKYGSRRLMATLGEEAIKQVLLRTGLVSREQCDEVLAEKKRTGRDMFQLLIDRGLVKKHELGEALSEELEIPYVDLKQTRPDEEALELLPEHLARQNHMIPIGFSDDKARLAMAHPQDVAAREQFRMMVSMEVEPVLSFEKDILDAIEEHYGEQAAERTEGESKSALERLKARLRKAAAVDEGVVSMAESAGVINLVASMIEGAINSHATDIHLEPQMGALRVRYRIDGLLYDIMNLPEHLQEEVISRVKVLADMDITERRRPQDGHFTIEALGRTYDLRVATLPTVLGEKMVLRLLNPEDVFKGLRELGLESDQREVLETGIAQPFGMILATGPIGSGKTTTLYAVLSQIDILTQNVVTIEDPVEYQLPGINQVQVDRRIERTFANMLRSVVRQDANVMMVGEIRDPDTAQVAIGAARTGHLVFSTMHTNDAVGAITTLGHLGIPRFLITSSLVAVVAQRLVRKVCANCKEEYQPDETLLSAAGLSPKEVQETTFYRGAGCEECFHVGYAGRTGIFEVLRMTDALKGLILHRATHEEMLSQARADGMITLLESGLKKVRAGITTMEEVLRVTALTGAGAGEATVTEQEE